MSSLEKRITAPKFRIGDRVRILPQGQTIFVGVEGVIDGVHPNDRGIAVPVNDMLDRVREADALRFQEEEDAA